MNALFCRETAPALLGRPHGVNASFPQMNKHPALLTTISLLTLLAGILWATAALAQPPLIEEQDRAASAGPVRYVLVKAFGQGTTPQEAEEAALKTARSLAAQHLASLGGAQALSPSPEGQRVVTLHPFPQMGFSPARAVLLLELRLRGQTEPLQPSHQLPVLRAQVNAGVLELSATRPCEAVAALEPATSAEPELLPGGTQTFRLTDKPLQHPLPSTEGRVLHVLACTGGLSVPANPANLEEAFTKARTGRSRPSLLQGVVSDCVEIRLKQGGSQRSMRQKGSETPMNMTGAAGRESGLPIGKPTP